MTEIEKQQIQKRGVNARALGMSQFDNPYLKPDALPSATGENIWHWQEKHDLWDLGWHLEDAIR